jgi:hypothetical protein
MKLQTLAAACAALVSVSAASAALAGEPITAKLQAPVAQPTKFIAGGAMFVCESDACYAQAPTSTTYSTATCKIIAGKVGAVSSYGETRKSLDADKLGQCNTVAVARAAGGSELAKR